ncbi:restriction endonuclease subunit S [Bacillus cereus]|uniref:Type I restriction modification DNA specificity domain-containing protein n=1 Tax=Bacillus cereus TaxID=1396 RepID=A0A1S9U962_BACCE|nr:restriction endonuclease subunit S [Bacillus cereus]OOR18830.1 hypothetical protein BW892_26090 [Bacillus cereus]
MNFKQTSLGLIPKDWEVDIINNIKSTEKNSISMGPFGSKIKKENFIDSGVPIIRGVNLKKFEFFESDFVFVSEEKAEELKASWVKQKDIVITHRGTLGQVGFIPENSKYKKYIVSQSGMKLTCDENKVVSKFLYYYLNSRIGQYFLLMNKSQVGVPAIAQASTSLKKIPVPLPPINEQKAIANILASLDEKIATNNQINNRLEEMAQTIFKHWFVDFEFPNEIGDPYKSKGGEMVESEQGMIPKGWVVFNMGEFITVTDGTHASPKKQEQGYPLITSKHIKNNNLLLHEANLISEKDYSEVNKRSKVDTNDILITMIGTVGVFYYVREEKIEFAIKNLGLFKMSQRQLYANYVFLYLNSKQITDYLITRHAGSTQQYISLTELRKIPLVLPSEEIITKFNNFVESIFKQIQELKLQNETLIEIRDTLLPKFMSGEIRVPVK